MLNSVHARTENPIPVPGGHWLFVVAILSGPYFPIVSDVCLFCHIVILAAHCPWRASLADRRVAGVAAWLLLCCCWFIARTGYHLGLGVHTLTDPFRFPVTVLDYVPFLLFFFVRSLIPISPVEVRHTLWAIVGANLLRFPVALGQKFFSLRLSYSWEIFDLPLVRFVVHPMYRSRVDAGFSNGNMLACSMLLCLFAAAALLVWYIPEWRRARGETRLSRPFLVLLVLVATIFCALTVLIWSGSRNTWMVLALILPVFSRIAGVKWQYIIISILLIGLLVGFSVIELGTPTQAARTIVPKIVWGRIVGLPELKPSRLSWRLEVFGHAADMVRERPWTGRGIGEFAPECERRQGCDVNHAHNIFLQLATEIGVPVTVLFTAIIGAIFLSAGRRLFTLPRDRWRTVLSALYLTAVAMVLLHQLSLAMLHANQLEMVFWWCLAIPYSLALRSDQRK